MFRSDSTTSAEKSASPASQISLSPFYHAAVNEIKKPESLVYCSRYFQKRWQRELGPVGVGIVLCLRSHCFYNRKTGELRNEITLPAAVIAEEVGVSVKTIRREMEGNRALQQFLRVRPKYTAQDTSGGIRRDANIYEVAMDDPLHPDDEAQMTEIVRRREAEREKSRAQQEEEAKARAQNEEKVKAPAPCGQNDQAADRVVNLTRGRDKLTTPCGQNDHALKDYSRILKNNTTPLNVATSNVTPEQLVISLTNTTDPPAQPPTPGNTDGGEAHHDKAGADTASPAWTPPHVRDMARQALALTGDTPSRRRYEQLAGIALEAGRGDAWDAAFKATEARLKKSAQPLNAPGAYFCATLARLLEGAGVYLPVGTPEERQDVKAQIAASLGLGEAAPGRGQAATKKRPDSHT